METPSVRIDEQQVDAAFSGCNQSHLPGAAVGIAVDGEPVYRKGFGLASMELPVVLSPSIRMRVFSSTKQFTCLAYMLLCDEGRAGLDDSIGKYLPELHPVTKNVSIRQLMGHVSGIRDAFGIAMMMLGAADCSVPSTDIVSLYKDIGDVNFAPGTSWRYNNGAYTLLSAAIERIADCSLEEVLYTRILKPVGMHASLLRRYHTDFVPNSATLHVRTADGSYDRKYNPGALSGEGGLVSTVDDMLRWLGQMDRPVVGSKKSWEAMKVPQKLSNGTETGFGLGLIAGNYRGVETINHSGGGWGGGCEVLKVPRLGLDVVVLVNRSDVSAPTLAQRVLDACIDGLEPRSSTTAGVLSTGIFRSPTTDCVIQLYVKDGQQWGAINGCPLRFVNDEGPVLRPAPELSYCRWMITLVGDAEAPSSIRFSDFGNVDELFAVETVARQDGTGIAGSYRWEATDTEATISTTKDGVRLEFLGRFGAALYRLSCIGDGIWQAELVEPLPWKKRNSGLIGVLCFDRKNGGFRWSTVLDGKLTFRRR